MLTRIVLAGRYCARPHLIPMAPDPNAMLAAADAALIIGDPALKVVPGSLPYQVLDLGAEWCELTGLPMVFAVWAGPERYVTPESARVFVDSAQFGLANLGDIVAEAPASHSIPSELARAYLTGNIVFELTDRDRKGLDLYRRKVGQLRAGEL